MTEIAGPMPPAIGRGRRDGQAASPTGVLITLADYGFAFFVFFIASDAFSYLGVHSLLWLAAYGYVLLRLLALFRPFIGFLRDNAVYLSYPVLCTVSVLWSDVPRATAVFAIQLLASVLIALFIAMRLPIEAVFRQLLRVYLVAMAASLATLAGVFVHPWDHRGNFTGVFLSKNAFGHRAVLFAIGCVMAALLLPGAGPARRGLYLVALAVTAGMVAASGSATAIVLTTSFGLAAAALHFLCTRRLGAALVAVPVVLAFVLASLTVVVLRIDPVAEIFDLLGRDATMTGRTILWRHGWDHYLSRPLLGFGAAGYWQNPAYASEIAALQSAYGEGVGAFHNIALELLVMLGPAGLLAHGLCGGVTLARAVVLLRRTRDAMAVWVIVTTLALYGMALIGAQLYNPHAIPLILVVCLGGALGKRLSAARTP